MNFRLVPKSVTLNDLERRNHRICVRYVVVKQLLGLSTFQNLLLIVYDHKLLIRSACGLDGRVHFNDREFSSGLITRFDGRRCLALA